jgi:hypothetical protein
MPSLSTAPGFGCASCVVRRTIFEVARPAARFRGFLAAFRLLSRGSLPANDGLPQGAMSFGYGAADLLPRSERPLPGPEGSLSQGGSSRPRFGSSPVRVGSPRSRAGSSRSRAGSSRSRAGSPRSRAGSSRSRAGSPRSRAGSSRSRAGSSRSRAGSSRSRAGSFPSGARSLLLCVRTLSTRPGALSRRVLWPARHDRGRSRPAAARFVRALFSVVSHAVSP